MVYNPDQKKIESFGSMLKSMNYSINKYMKNKGKLLFTREFQSINKKEMMKILLVKL